MSIIIQTEIRLLCAIFLYLYQLTSQLWKENWYAITALNTNLNTCGKMYAITASCTDNSNYCMRWSFCLQNKRIRTDVCNLRSIYSWIMWSNLLSLVSIFMDCQTLTFSLTFEFVVFLLEMISLVFYSSHCELDFTVWLDRRKPRK